MPVRIAQILGGVLLGLVATALWFAAVGVPSTNVAPADADIVGGMAPQPFDVPTLRGIDPRGDSVTTDAWLGRTTAVFFGYTSCPDVCPITLARVGRYRSELPEDIRDEFAVLFVSLDPARDTPERVGQYVSALPGGVQGMTADDIRAQAEGWGVRAEDGAPFGDGGYLVDHTARTFILNPQGEVTATLPPMPGSDVITPLLDRLLGR